MRTAQPTASSRCSKPLAKLVVNDHAFTGFAEPELVAELDLGTGFATLDDVDFAKRSKRAAVALWVAIPRSVRVSMMNSSSRPEAERMLSSSPQRRRTVEWLNQHLLLWSGSLGIWTSALSNLSKPHRQPRLFGQWELLRHPSVRAAVNPD